MNNLQKRPEINLEEIWKVKPIESDKEIVPGWTEKWPLVDFMDHSILEKRTFHKNRMVKIANYRFPAIGI